MMITGDDVDWLVLMATLATWALWRAGSASIRIARAVEALVEMAQRGRQ